MTQTPENATLPIEIEVSDVKQLMDSESDFLLIDCRESNEFEYCKIETAQLIPMNQTPAHLDGLEPHRQTRIVVFCHHGGRSYQVVQYLRSQGFLQAQNMAGGIDVWSQVVDPTVPRY